MAEGIIAAVTTTAESTAETREGKVAVIEAARTYYDRGWTAIPLGLDANGHPKRPIPFGWQNQPHDWDEIKTLPWDRAAGIGLVLGEPSGGLAAIDVDDNELADWLFARLVRSHLYCRMVWTLHRRLHIFVQEEKPSESKNFKVRWRGREFGVELKAAGTQVATVPTPGYVLGCDKPPAPATSVLAAWAPLASAAGIDHLNTGSGGYPPPWQPQVVRGDRNKAAYVEAHRLREARVPLETAIEMMQARWDSSYEPGDTAWREIERTIRSAYGKGLPPGQAVYEVWAR